MMTYYFEVKIGNVYINRNKDARNLFYIKGESAFESVKDFISQFVSEPYSVLFNSIGFENRVPAPNDIEFTPDNFLNALLNYYPEACTPKVYINKSNVDNISAQLVNLAPALAVVKCPSFMNSDCKNAFADFVNKNSEIYKQNFNNIITSTMQSMINDFIKSEKKKSVGVANPAAPASKRFSDCFSTSPVPNRQFQDCKNNR